MDLQEPLWFSIIFLTSVPVSSREYMPKYVRKHTNDCIQTHIDVPFFVLTAEAMKLTVLLQVV
jgi:hypothetical protein